MPQRAAGRRTGANIMTDFNALYAAVMAVLPPELGALAPLEWLQLCSVAVVSWLGGHAITRGDLRR